MKTSKPAAEVRKAQADRRVTDADMIRVQKLFELDVKNRMAKTGVGERVAFGASLMALRRDRPNVAAAYEAWLLRS